MSSMISRIYSGFSNLTAFIYPSNIQTNQETKALVQSENKAPVQGHKENLTSAIFLKHKSEIDPTQEISLSQWAVTIAIVKNGFHAVLFIEGLDEKMGRIREKCHLTGLDGCTERTNPLHVLRCYNKQGYVRVTKILEPIQMGGFGPNHKTWLRPREKVELMRALIYYEMDHREESPFCVLGKNSIFASKVVVLKTDDRELSEMQAKDFTRFHRLYNLLIDYRTLERPRKIEGVFDSHKKIELITTSLLDKTLRHINRFGKEHPFYSSTAQILGLLVAPTVPVVIARTIVAISVSYVSFHLVKNIKTCVQAKHYQKELKLIESKENKIKKLNFESNSCFTWTREKLAMIDVFLKKSSIENIVSIPTTEEGGGVNKSVETAQERMQHVVSIFSAKPQHFYLHPEGGLGEEGVENCNTYVEEYMSGIAFNNTKDMPIPTLLDKTFCHINRFSQEHPFYYRTALELATLVLPRVTAVIGISYTSFHLLKSIKIGVQAKYYQKELKADRK